MKKYKVTITETLQMEVEVEAENSVQAEEIVHNKYHHNDYVLDADRFQGVEFTVRVLQKDGDLATA